MAQTTFWKNPGVISWLGEEKATNSKRGTREGKEEHTGHALPRGRASEKAVGTRGRTALPRAARERTGLEKRRDVSKQATGVF